MARIAPFHGVRYTLAELRQCVAPPYDVITPPELFTLRQFPYNITHLTLPDSYEEAAKLWREWQQQGVLRAEPSPVMYLLEQQFSHPATGRPHRRLALVCLMALEEYDSGVVLPHENTQARAKEDRLQLLRATEANLEPIYGLVEGGLFPVLEDLAHVAPIVAEVEYTDGLHRLYRIEEASALEHLTALVAPSRVWIADGHHRYETCLQYRRERRAAEANPEQLQPYDWLMIALTSFEDPGVVILPTHRAVLQASEETLNQLPDYLAQWFEIHPCAAPEAVHCLHKSASRKGFAVVMQADKAFTAWLKEDAVPETLVSGERSLTFRHLDVTLLQALVLEPLFGITQHHLERAEGIRYTRDESEAIQWVSRGEAAVAFLLKPPTVQEVREVALAGEKMPPKSTYFYPKLLSGLVMRGW
ncbi:MAG: phosphatase [Armatimonadota bacterium]|nr:MAG: phosphatase [Armatimonadota bacterium]